MGKKAWYYIDLETSCLKKLIALQISRLLTGPGEVILPGIKASTGMVEGRDKNAIRYR